MLTPTWVTLSQPRTFTPSLIDNQGEFMLLFKQKGDHICQIDCLKSVQASLQLVFKWRSATQCYNLLLQLHQHIIRRGNTQNDVEEQVWDSGTLHTPAYWSLEI
jgi:hypothetical protein